MLVWLVAAAVGVTWAAASYLPAPHVARVLAPAALRAFAVTLLVALLADALIGRARQRLPLVALDVSSSWLRGGDTTQFALARRLADSLRADTLLLFGDSVRAGEAPAAPLDMQSTVRPVVERALASGRAVHVVTDGLLSDADALGALPSGSDVQLIAGAAAAGRDAAVIGLDAPRAVVSGDTVEVRVTVAAGAGGAPGGTVHLVLGARALGTLRIDSLSAYAERSLVARAVVPPGEERRILRAALAASDAEARNDTLAVVIETTPAAGAVFVSTSPDFDARDALAVLRGALAISTRGYYRVANGQWRVDGTLAAVSEEEVRRAVVGAPLLVIHGDTAVFGPPRAVTRGSLALVVPVRERGGEWFVTGAPPSPVAASLSGIAWDSLPPLEVVSALPAGDWTGLEARRSRRFERRAVIVGYERPRRVVLVGASGFWRWRFRAGTSADAFASVWGSLLDWLAAERPDIRSALPVEGVMRAGEPVRWRRGGADSVVAVNLRRRGAAGVDSITLHFAPGQTIAESGPLVAGVYEASARGGSSLMVVNASRELVPARPTVRAGRVGAGSASSDARRARTVGLLFALAIVFLCGEWVLRRRLGLR